MAKPRFLSLDGVRILVSYFKDQLSGKVDKVDGKSLSDNNFSDEEKAKLAGIEADSQVNVIESISVNGTDQTITNKNVNIDVPLVDDALQNEGQAADAKATGDAIDELSQSISSTATEIRGEIADEVADIEQSISAVQESIPTDVSQLNNDAEYTNKDYVDNQIDSVQSSIPTNVSDLTNDSNFTTQTYVDTELAKKQDTINFATPTSSDIGKALMPKTVENGEVTEWEFGEAGIVDDVQINGTSIVENKIANIPLATDDYDGTPGLVKIFSGMGLTIENGMLTFSSATEPLCKSGISSKKVIVPSNQHISTFYGLAKASGDITQSQSENPLGIYTNEAKAAIQSMLGVPSVDDIPEVPVQDVQINGTTILGQDGVANIPIADSNVPGVVQVNDQYGIALLQEGQNGALVTTPTICIYGATNGRIKNANGDFNPITASKIDRATFYGLAKAAGHDEKDSTLSFGTYTDEAKTAIQSMLGIDTAIADAMSGITGFDYSVVQELPVTGEKGIIYLVAHSHDTDDGYDEYIWVNNAFEKLGNTDITLSNYVTFDDYASTSKAGLLKVGGAASGLSLDSEKYLKIARATDNNIKEGADFYRPIVASNQHQSVFYGLAKASGDTTQSVSNNEVGTYTDEAKASIQSMLGVPSIDDIPQVPVQDVQINDVSILGQNGIANIPVAGTSTFGVIKMTTGRGIELNTQNQLQIVGADVVTIKAGTDLRRPITPNNVHTSVFYGLTKAAGVDMSNSNNTIGTYTDDAKAAIKNMIGINVDDVQVNGTSVVTNGVAEIPTADADIYGVVKVGQGLFVQTSESTAKGQLTIYKAGENEIKAGTNGYKPIVPQRQHQSAFYGLAKAAGDTTQAASSNAVGTYTDNAKSAIQNMLGVTDIIGAEFDANESYSAGDYVIYDGKLYKFTDDHATGAFDGTDAEEVTITEEMVSDVTVNGTSIVSSGVANIPVADASTLGVVMTNNSAGIDINPSTSKLHISNANPSQVRNGTDAYKPITPSNQHQSTFYGLAKAAGVDMASSSNAVGVYTEEAKAAIKSMLGIPNISYPTAITVTTPPDNVNYEIGSSFDKTGMAVTLIWSTGETRILLENEYTVTPSVFSTLGTQNITITYRGTEPYVLTTTQEVSVVNIIPDTWAKIVQISKAGVARNYFEVGDIINDTYTINNNVITNPWIIMDFRTVELENGETYDNVPIIQMQYATHENVVFDAKEEIEATEETAQSGFYYFGMVTEENVWTALNLSEGATIPYGDYDNVYKTRVNSWNPIRYGLNNWKLSFARQYLNNSGIGWATAQHDCDVLPTNAGSMIGFKSLISSDMATALHPIKIETKQSNYFGAVTDITYDTFWLASVSEMNLSNSSASTDDGEPWEYYKQLLESETKLPTGTFDILKKYDISAQTTARYHWLRSAYLGGSSEWNLSTSGNVTTYYPYSNNRLVPACAII